MLVFEYTGWENSPSYQMKFRSNFRYWRKTLDGDTYHEFLYSTERELKDDMKCDGRANVAAHDTIKLTSIESKFIAVIYGYDSVFTPEVTVHMITSENDAIISTDDESQWFLLQCKYPDIIRVY